MEDRRAYYTKSYQHVGHGSCHWRTEMALRAVSTGMCRELLLCDTILFCYCVVRHTDAVQYSPSPFRTLQDSSTCLTLFNMHVATRFCECNLAVVNWSRRLCERKNKHIQNHCAAAQFTSFPMLVLIHYFCPNPGTCRHIDWLLTPCSLKLNPSGALLSEDT